LVDFFLIDEREEVRQGETALVATRYEISTTKIKKFEERRTLGAEGLIGGELLAPALKNIV